MTSISADHSLDDGFILGDRRRVANDQYCPCESAGSNKLSLSLAAWVLTASDGMFSTCPPSSPLLSSITTTFHHLQRPWAGPSPGHIHQQIIHHITGRPEAGVPCLTTLPPPSRPITNLPRPPPFPTPSPPPMAYADSGPSRPGSGPSSLPFKPAGDRRWDYERDRDRSFSREPPRDVSISIAPLLVIRKH